MRGLAAAIALAVMAAPGPELTAQSGRRLLENEYRLFKKRKTGRPTPTVTSAIERRWASFPYLPETLPIIGHNRRTRAAFNYALYRRALSYYELAQEESAKFRKQLNGLQIKRMNIRDRLWWKHIDQASRIDRDDRRLRRRYNQELAGHYRGIFSTLDRIDQESLRKEKRFRSLQRVAYRMYIVHQVAVGNTYPALEILKKYQAFPGSENEWPMHYYLSVCYGVALRQARRDTGVPEHELKRLRRLKNKHLVDAVELKYGRDSVQYDYIYRKVRLEMLGNPRTSR